MRFSSDKGFSWAVLSGGRVGSMRIWPIDAMNLIAVRVRNAQYDLVEIEKRIMSRRASQPRVWRTTPMVIRKVSLDSANSDEASRMPISSPRELFYEGKHAPAHGASSRRSLS